MIPTDPKLRKEMIERMLKACWNDSDSLTQWECNFIESCNGQFAFKENLSDRQCEILEKIYDKI